MVFRNNHHPVDDSGRTDFSATSSSVASSSVTSSVAATSSTGASAASKISQPTTIPSNVNKHDIDALICKEMNQLSLQERERTFDEIHGVQPIVQETPQLITWALHQFHVAVSRIPHKPAYLVALQQSEAYVKSPQFVLMFLRAASFDVNVAAQKCVNFCQGKLDLFGLEPLTRSLQLSDLDPDDLACLRSGAYQILPARDSAGRFIIVDFHLTMPQCYRSPQNLLKALAFLQLAAAEDEENQRRGNVGIAYYMGEFNHSLNHSLNQQVAQMATWIPLKLHALHICLNHESELQAWKPLAMLLLGCPLRLRVRIHEGLNQAQVNESLLTFGIPIDCLPMSHDGIVKTAAHMKWVQRRKYLEDHRMILRINHQQQQEQQNGGNGQFHYTPWMIDGGIVDMPGKWDVILRRGRVYQDHPGNIRMKQIMESQLTAYGEATSVKEKNAIVQSIMHKVQHDDIDEATTAHGGCSARFVERTPNGWWAPVEESDTLRRLGKSLRSLYTKSKQQQQIAVAVPAAAPEESTAATTVPSQSLLDQEQERPIQPSSIVSEDMDRHQLQQHKDKRARTLNPENGTFIPVGDLRSPIVTGSIPADDASWSSQLSLDQL